MLSKTTTTAADAEEARSRTALIGYIADKLQPLFCTRPVHAVLADWLAPLSIAQLIECLGQDAAATADALASRLIGSSGTDDTAAELTFLAELEFPRLPHNRRLQLAAFAGTVRRLALDGDGTAKAGDLYAEGYSSTQVHDLMPRARRLLALLGGTAQRGRLPEDHTTPSARLAAAGARAASFSAQTLAGR